MQNRIWIEPLPFPETSQRGRLQLLQPIKITAETAGEDEMLTVHDLTQFSNFLAREFNYKSFHAAYEPASWYREQVGADICSEGQASLLRMMTVKRCNEGPGKLDEDACGHTSWWKRRSESLDAFSLVCVLAFLFVIAGLIARDGR